MRATIIIAGVLIAALFIIRPGAVRADACSDSCEKAYASCSKSCKKSDTNCFTKCINEKESCLAKCK